MIPENPFSIVRDRLWTIIDANPFFKAWIRDSNRIRYSDEIGEKRSVGHGDLPEIVVVPTEFSQSSLGDSACAYVTAGFKIVSVTGRKNLDMVSAINWEIFRCIQTFMATVSECQYDGREFVTSCAMASGMQGMTEPENLGVGGWTAVWTLAVDMAIDNEYLIYEVL